MGISNIVEYSSAFCITYESTIGTPSSLNAIAPSSIIAPISVISLPFWDLVTAPIGKIFMGHSSDQLIMYLINSGESIGGSEFGIAHTPVKPPARAANDPVFKSSLSSPPGSRK